MRQLFLSGIASGKASFETDETVPERWEDFIYHKHRDCLIVITDETDQVIAWAGLAPTSHRACYWGVAETQLYIDQNHQGQGHGKRLLAELMDLARERGFWTLQAIVFPENTASISLFSGMGFRRVGHRERIARMNGEWRDTLLYELRLPSE